MSNTLEGECACKAVRYRLDAAPMFVQSCHCLNCQRQTGSAFVINMLIEKDHVELLRGEPVAVDVPRDQGVQRIMRCPTCQIAVWSFYTRPQIALVRAGTLDDPSAVAPMAHVFTRTKLPWVVIPDSIPAFEVYYDFQKVWPAESIARLQAV